MQRPIRHLLEMTDLPRNMRRDFQMRIDEGLNKLEYLKQLETPKVLEKIDLDAIDSSTRPKKRL